MKTFSKIFESFSGAHTRHSSKNQAEIVNNSHETEEFERCVMCGAITAIPISMPVDWRENYELGCGQLCIECAKKQREDALFDT